LYRFYLPEEKVFGDGPLNVAGKRNAARLDYAQGAVSRSRSPEMKAGKTMILE
jgi:hypothetical protein